MESEELPQPENWLIHMKKMIYSKQLFVILGLIVAISFGIAVALVVPSTAWSVHSHNEQDQKISESSQEMQHQISEVIQKMCEQDQKISELNQTIFEMQQQLAQAKANQTDLASNMTSLVESTIRTSEYLKLSAELNVTRETLADTQQALQDELIGTQEDLYNATTMISVLQREFENLASNVTSLSENTVKTDEFLKLHETVDDLETTALQMQDNISLLRLNFTNQIGYINTALTGKADQHDVDILRETVTTLSDTTVTLTAFEILEENVQSLATNKADQASLDQLKSTVNQLDDASAKQQALHSLDGKVSGHISSSQQTHDQHGSRISDNGRKIQSNTDRINSVEDEVQDLKTDSTCGLTASWKSIISSTAVFLVLVSVYAY